MGECQICSGELGLLGVLGNTGHLLCRNCGMQCSRELDTEDLELIATADEEEE